MQALVLAGGKGSRLGHELPKPLVPVAGISMLQHALAWLAGEGVRDVLVASGHGGELVDEAAMTSGTQLGLRVTARRETTPLGTAGAARALLDELHDRFLVVYADVFAAVDLGPLLEVHHTTQADATLVAHPNDHPFDSDRLVTDVNGRVLRVVRRSDREGPEAGALASAALYVVERSLVARIPDDGKPRDFAHDVFPAEIARDARIFAYRTSEYLKDMGTPERRARVEEDLRAGIPPLLRRHGDRDGFLVDRDGVLVEDTPYISDPSQLQLIEGTAEALASVNRARVAVACCTNQPVVARGAIDAARLHEIHQHLEGLLGARHGWIDAIFSCPHHPHGGFPGERAELKYECRCRKPRAGLLDDAVTALGLRRSTSVYVGDRTTDLAAARAAGLVPIGVLTGQACRDGAAPLDEEAPLLPDLGDAATFFLHAPGSVADRVLPRLGAHDVVLIGGPSRAGKTLLANALRLALGRRGVGAVHVSLDRFLTPDAERRAAPVFAGRLRMADAQLAVTRLASGESVLLPGYDPRSRQRAAGAIFSRAKGSLLIVDGLLAHDLELENAFRLAVTSDDASLRTRRDAFYAWKGLPPPTDRDEEHAEVARSTRRADATVAFSADFHLTDAP